MRNIDSIIAVKEAHNTIAIAEMVVKLSSWQQLEIECSSNRHKMLSVYPGNSSRFQAATEQFIGFKPQRRALSRLATVIRPPSVP